MASALQLSARISVNGAVVIQEQEAEDATFIARYTEGFEIRGARDGKFLMESRMRRPLRAALLATAIAPAAVAQIPEQNLAWTVSGGIGLSYHLHNRNSDERLLLLVPDVAKPLSRHWEYVLEGQLSRFTSPPGYFVGLLPVGARYLPLASRVGPFISVDLGLGWTDLTHIPELSRRFNFALQGSLGARWQTRDDRSMQISGTFLHVSNGGTHEPNLGLNVVALLIGWRIR